MEITIFIVFVVFVLVWEGIFGEGSFGGTVGIGCMFFGLGQTLDWIGLPSQISFYIATGGFMIVIVPMYIDGRRFRHLPSCIEFEMTEEDGEDSAIKRWKTHWESKG